MNFTIFFTVPSQVTGKTFLLSFFFPLLSAHLFEKLIFLVLNLVRTIRRNKFFDPNYGAQPQK